MKPAYALIVYEDGSSPDLYVEKHNLHLKNNSYILGAGKPCTAKLLMNFSQCAVKETPLITGIIPENLIRYNNNNLNPELTWIVPAGKRYLYFSKDMPESGLYPCPALLCIANKKELKVFALKTNSRQIKTLYYAPFPNIYPDGRVCTGNAQLKINLKTFSSFQTSWENIFFNSVFTHWMAFNTKITATNTSELYASLINTEQFPVEELICYKKNISLDTL